MRSGLRALAALCSIALSVNTGCTKDPLRSSEVTQENDSAVRAETADASAISHMHTVRSDPGYRLGKQHCIYRRRR